MAAARAWFVWLAPDYKSSRQGQRSIALSLTRPDHGDARGVLRENFGFSEFPPGQAEARCFRFANYVTPSRISAEQEGYPAKAGLGLSNRPTRCA
jgi:hypothetical protein